MKRRQLLIVGAIVVASCLGAILWQSFHSQEPVADGKPLSFWLEQYRANRITGSAKGDELCEQARRAIQRIGTNAIPVLLEMLRKTDSSRKEKLLTFGRKFHFLGASLHPASTWNFYAADGFRILGADAREAVPAITEIFEENISQSSQRAAAESLWAIGIDVGGLVPTLVRATTNSSPIVRFHAVYALGGMHAEPEKVVPVLVMCLNDTDVDVQLIALRSVGDFGTNASKAIPVLLQLASSASPPVRRAALGALGEVHSASDVVVPALITYLGDSNANIRAGAAVGLAGFGVDAQAAIPPLVHALQDEEKMVRDAAEQSLLKIRSGDLHEPVRSD